MHVRTDRFGNTVLHGAVSQAPTLESRVTRVLSTYGVKSQRLHTSACELVRAHPSLTAEQAVDYVVSKL